MSDNCVLVIITFENLKLKEGVQKTFKYLTRNRERYEGERDGRTDGRTDEWTESGREGGREGERMLIII